MSSTSSSASGSGSNLDEIKASLKSHNDSFDQLLRYIPAKFYMQQEEEQVAPTVPLTKTQKKAAKKNSQKVEVKAAKSDALRKAKLARYDPNEPKTIQEIQLAKLDAIAKGKEKASASDSDWESEGAEEEDEEEEEDSANDTDFNDSDEEGTNGPLGKLNPRPAGGDAPSITELRLKLQKRIADIQAAKKSSGATGAVEGGDEESAQSREELLDARRKQRGLVRDNRRKKRKAERREEKPKSTERVASNGRKGGGKANAPPKQPREEFSHGDDEDRPSKKAKATPPNKKVEAPSTAVVVAPAPAPVVVVAPKPKAVVPSTDPSTLSFSTLDFSTTALLAANAGSSALMKPKKNRHTLPKDPNAALEVLAARKEKLEALNPEQRERAEEKARWEKVELKASGEKVRDDEKRLKKMAKRQEKGKAKSAKAWAERKETVSSTINAKVAKRNTNMAARVQQAKDKKAGVKTKKKMIKTVSKSHAGRDKARPGFEGKSKK